MITSSGERRQVQIVGVDRPNRNVQIKFKDRGTTSAVILEVTPTFVWPQSGEVWMVERKHNTWYLCGKMESVADAVKLSELPIGDGYIVANSVRLKDGDYVVDSKIPLPLDITGSRSSGAALESLLTQLVAAGIIVDNTTP